MFSRYHESHHHTQTVHHSKRRGWANPANHNKASVHEELQFKGNDSGFTF